MQDEIDSRVKDLTSQMVEVVFMGDRAIGKTLRSTDLNRRIREMYPDMIFISIESLLFNTTTLKHYNTDDMSMVYDTTLIGDRGSGMSMSTLYAAHEVDILFKNKKYNKLGKNKFGMKEKKVVSYPISYSAIRPIVNTRMQA
jgi:hypothetical protein